MLIRRSPIIGPNLRQYAKRVERYSSQPVRLHTQSLRHRLDCSRSVRLAELCEHNAISRLKTQLMQKI